jgi:hypothetical protein
MREHAVEGSTSCSDLDVKEIVIFGPESSAAVWAGAEMNARMLGIICALLAAMPSLIGCESSRSYDYQFEKQVKRAQECRQLQDKLVGDQPLTPEGGEEIANTMAGAGCTARLPSADAGVPPRFPAQR